MRLAYSIQTPEYSKPEFHPILCLVQERCPLRIRKVISGNHQLAMTAAQALISCVLPSSAVPFPLPQLVERESGRIDTDNHLRALFCEFVNLRNEFLASALDCLSVDPS